MSIGPSTLAGSALADYLRGLAGSANIVAGNDGDDRIIGRGLADFLMGGVGNDIISGNNGNDTLLGGRDDDQLFGGNGRDVLSGDLGTDTLTGGNGADTFLFNGKQNDGATDTITDFVLGTDMITLAFATGFGVSSAENGALVEIYTESGLASSVLVLGVAAEDLSSSISFL